MRLSWISLFFILMLTLSACLPQQASPSSEAPQGDLQVPPTREPTRDSSNAPFLTATEITIMPDFSSAPLEKFVNLTKKDLATQLNIDIETISLTNSMQVTWPNSALGCPRPGEVYAQGLVPGYRILLTANQVEYTYHTDLTGRLILCPDQSEDSGNPPLPGPTIGVPID